VEVKGRNIITVACGAHQFGVELLLAEYLTFFDTQDYIQYRIRIFSIALPSNVAEIIFRPLVKVDIDNHVPVIMFIEGIPEDLRIAVAVLMHFSNQVIFGLFVLFSLKFTRAGNAPPRALPYALEEFAELPL